MIGYIASNLQRILDSKKLVIADLPYAPGPPFSVKLVAKSDDGPTNKEVMAKGFSSPLVRPFSLCVGDYDPALLIELPATGNTGLFDDFDVYVGSGERLP